MGLYETQLTKCNQEYGRGVVPCFYVAAMQHLRVCCFQNALGLAVDFSPGLGVRGEREMLPSSGFPGNYISDCTPPSSRDFLKTSEKEPQTEQEEGRFAWKQEATRGSKILYITVNVTISVLSAC